MERKYRVLLYPEGYGTKEKANDFIGKIKSTILNYPADISIEDLGDALEKGQPVCLGHMKKTRQGRETCKKTNWVGQQLLAVDIDNSEKHEKVPPGFYLSIDDALKRCAAQGIPPVLLYETLSSAPEWERFRIVWALDAPVTDVKEFESVMGALAFIFSVNGQTQIDRSCNDLSRVFYGAKAIRLMQPDAVISRDMLLNTKKLDERVSTQKLVKEILKQDVDLSVVPLPAQYLVEEIHDMEKGSRSCKSIRPNILKDIKDFLLQNGVLKQFGISESDFRRWPTRPLQFDTSKIASDFLRFIPLDKLLFEASVVERFHCFLQGADHDRNDPSAYFYFNLNERRLNGEPAPDGWFYKCFSCGTGAIFDIFGILQLISHASQRMVARYLYQKFNIKCETEWQAEQKKDLDYSEEYLHTEEFVTAFPTLHKRMLLGNLYGTYHLLVSHARQSILDKERTGVDMPLFCVTVRQLVKTAPSYGIKKDRRCLMADVKMLARYGLLKICSDQDLPERFRAFLNSKRFKQKTKYRMEVYSIPPMSAELALQASKQIRADRAHGIRKRSFCKDAAVMDNADLAKLSYGQYQDKAISAKCKEFYQLYKQAAEKAMEDKPYTCEKEILANLSSARVQKILGKMTASKRKKEIQRYADMCLPHLLNDTDIDVCRISYKKNYAMEYGIVSSKKYRFRPGASRIIVKNSLFKGK